MAYGLLETNNALLQASAKEAASNSNLHQRLALSHRAEGCAHFDCSKLDRVAGANIQRAGPALTSYMFCPVGKRDHANCVWWIIVQLRQSQYFAGRCAVGDMRSGGWRSEHR